MKRLTLDNLKDKVTANDLQIFGREHLKVNVATQNEIIKRYNLHSELIEALKGVLNNVDDAGNVSLSATGKVLAEIKTVLNKTSS